MEVNKSKISSSDDMDGPSRKRRTSQTRKHYYPNIPPSVDDEESQKRNVALPKTEIAKAKPQPSILRELMGRIFNFRQKWIRSATDMPLLETVLVEFPLLKKSLKSFNQSYLFVYMHTCVHLF